MVINNLFHTAETAKTVSEIAVNADGSREETSCRIVSEHAVELFINEQLVLKVVCTPSNLVELVMGRMISEGYITSADDVESIYVCSSGCQAKVFLKEEAGAAMHLTKAVMEVPTCCTDNQIFLRNQNALNTKLQNSRQWDSEEVAQFRLPKAEWKSEWVFGLANEFANGSKIHRATKGTHCCYLSIRGEVVFASEDIGRHNAMDKAIGYAVMQGLKREECILYTTGRVPTDMVKKVVMSRIPVLVAKSVPTDAAIEMARAYNLTLICKAWPDRYEIFHEAEAIVEKSAR